MWFSRSCTTGELNSPLRVRVGVKTGRWGRLPVVYPSCSWLLFKLDHMYQLCAAHRVVAAVQVNW